MGRAETGITDTGERDDPLALKQRRTAVGWQQDAQAARGDGEFKIQGLRKAGGGVPYKGNTPEGITGRRRGSR